MEIVWEKPKYKTEGGVRGFNRHAQRTNTSVWSMMSELDSLVFALTLNLEMDKKQSATFGLSSHCPLMPNLFFIWVSIHINQ